MANVLVISRRSEIAVLYCKWRHPIWLTSYVIVSGCVELLDSNVCVMET